MRARGQRPTKNACLFFLAEQQKATSHGIGIWILGTGFPPGPGANTGNYAGSYSFFKASHLTWPVPAGNVREALVQLLGVHSRQNRTQCSLCPSCPVARGPWVWVSGHVGPLTASPAESGWQGLRSVSGVLEALAPAGVVGSQQTSADDDEWNLHSSKRLLGFQR